ncbi:dihydrolipoamide acetyltransferase family protein [Streptomyces kebangsaanensis]|uniref:Dihydrolipoamide acetyltransferase component of pyruvate dehydrogenase complex n=1 Tax=Streptomyces kebangsaanensis TaxID=864058 RepID=A0ABW6KV46_9ACTN
MGEFTMPSLGADMEAGTLQEWLVAPGDTVTRGDVIAVVETDKSAVEVECFESGTVGRLLVAPGTRVPVGAPLALIEAAGRETAARDRAAAPVEQPAAPRPRKAGQEAAPVPQPPVVHAEAGPLVRHLADERGVDLTAVHGSGPGGRITRADVEGTAHEGGRRPRATPYARRLAAELRVDLGTVRGTGRDGAVRGTDVRKAAHLRAGPAPAAAETAAPARAPLPVPGRAGAAEPAAAMRRAIGDLMSRANREIPHYYLATTIDMSAALAWLRARNRELPVGERMLPAALLLKAVATAAVEVPGLNGFWQDGDFVPGRGVHLGFVVSLRNGGLAAPVVRDADSLAPARLMTRLKDLVERARRGRLRGTEITGGTLTVSSLGDQGVEAVYGVIYPPQVALVGFGAVLERPWADHGMIGVRPVVTATLSADHRASDGAVGARFLNAVDRLLQKPENL